jgi:hypothetical protein
MNSNSLFKPLERRRARIAALVDQHRTLQETRKKLQDAIANYKAFDPEVELGNINRLESIASDLSRKIAYQEIKKTELEQRLNEIRNAQTSPLAFWKFFTAEQKQLRADATRLGQNLSAVNQNLHTDNDALSNTRAGISSARQRISEHKNFNLHEAEQRYASIGPEINQIEEDLAKVRAELESIETKIQPHMRQLDRLQSELEVLNSDIAKANRLDRDLSSAANSYERAMIHQRCEEEFGTGSPKQVISDRRRKIRGLENNIPKLERRIHDELNKLERKISHLLIDGNNACYEGNSFIGLRGLSALLPKLRDRFKITVVFDASIRSMLKTDTQGVEQMLGPGAATHVAPTKSAADEYLLKLAGKDNGAFILSNDRFAEYHDYDAVRSGRVLRFLIADGKIMINDLDVSVSF